MILGLGIGLGLDLNDSISGLSHTWLLALVTLDPDLLGAERKMLRSP